MMTRDEIIAAVAAGKNLSGADLSRANLYGGDLSRANLYGADLSHAYLYGADLSGADLSHANLSRANLSRADLSHANLSRANLSRADLSGADLSHAHLYGANLGDQWIIQGPARSDGYAFSLERLTGDTVPMVRAGCRHFTLLEARKYWGETRGGTPLGEETFRILDCLEALQKARGLE